MGIPRHTVVIADGDRVPQLTIRIAAEGDRAQCTLRVAEEGDQPQMTVKIAEEGDQPQMTVILDGYSAGSAYAARVLDLSPIAYYQLNGDASDSSGNGYDGVASGATFGAAGIGDGNTAAAFDGNGDVIDISAMAGAFNGAQGTLIAWGQTAAWGDGILRYLARIAASATHLVHLQKTTVLNTLSFRRQAGVANAKTVSDTSLAGANTWFCAAITWDASGAGALKAYVNGVQVGSTQTGLSAFSGTPGAAIGALDAGGTSSWHGSLAHVAIFDRALSDADVLSVGVL